MNPRQLLDCIKEQLKSFEPLNENEYEDGYENAGKSGNHSDTFETGVELGQRMAYDEIRMFLAQFGE